VGGAQVCRECGHEVRPGSRFCVNCGESLPLPARQSDARLWTGLSIGAIWLSVLLLSVLAADLVSGSEHDVLPVAAMTSWFWGALATGLVLILCRRDATAATALSVAAVWLVVTLVGILVPEMVTGSDPTRIPVAALLAPVVGAVATGFVSALIR